MRVAVAVLATLSTLAAAALSDHPYTIDASPVTFVKDVDSYPMPPAKSANGLQMKSWSSESRGKKYTAHLATIEDPRYFRFEVAEGGPDHTGKVSETAKYRRCEYATNGGFFDMSTGATVASIVVNHTAVTPSDSFFSALGFTNDTITVGYLTEIDIKSGGFRTLLQGHGWLVRNGEAYVNVSVAKGEITSGFVSEMAPRTAVGLDSSGTLLLLVVDGEEDIRAGADLDMMEDIMLGLGAEYAINLDGGGSSDAVYDGKIVSHPTCQDNKTECERDVCTVTCISTEPMQ